MTNPVSHQTHQTINPNSATLKDNKQTALNPTFYNDNEYDTKGKKLDVVERISEIDILFSVNDRIYTKKLNTTNLASAENTQGLYKKILSNPEQAKNFSEYLQHMRDEEFQKHSAEGLLNNFSKYLVELDHIANPPKNTVSKIQPNEKTLQQIREFEKQQAQNAIEASSPKSGRSLLEQFRTFCQDSYGAAPECKAESELAAYSNFPQDVTPDANRIHVYKSSTPSGSAVKNPLDAFADAMQNRMGEIAQQGSQEVRNILQLVKDIPILEVNHNTNIEKSAAADFTISQKFIDAVKNAAITANGEKNADSKKLAEDTFKALFNGRPLAKLQQIDIEQANKEAVVQKS